MKAQAQLLQIHSEVLNEAWTNMMAFEIKFSSQEKFFSYFCVVLQTVKQQQ